MEFTSCETKEARTIHLSWKRKLQLKHSYTLAQRIMFLKQLHLILASGISILKGMELLEKRVDKRTAAICRSLHKDLQAGKPLAEAMQNNRDFFPHLVITLTRAGEQSGELHEVLASLVQYYNRQKELQGFLSKALIYPLFLIFLALCVLAFFLFYVLPVLATAYTALQAQPNGFLQLALQANVLLRHHPYLAGSALFSSLLAGFKLLPALGRLLLRIPRCRHVYQLAQEARFCKLLALLLNSGISITEAVGMAGSTLTDKGTLTKLQLFNRSLQRGTDISLAIEHSLSLFTPLTEELLSLGAATGYLPQMLEEAGRIAETDLEEKLSKLRELLTPALLMIAALLTGSIIYAVMGPLFNLFTALPAN